MSENLTKGTLDGYILTFTSDMGQRIDAMMYAWPVLMAGKTSTGKLVPVALDSSGNLTITATVNSEFVAAAALDGVWAKTTVSTIGGAALMGNDGTNLILISSGAGTAATAIRSTLASDDPAVVALQIMDDWDEGDRAKVNPIVGQAGVQGGSGAVSALTQRVVLATDVALPAGETHLGEVGGKTVVKDVTLSLDTSAYASGDLIAETQQVDAALRISNGTGFLQSLMVIDQDDQKVALTVYFLSANVSMGTENAAPSISDANALEILGYVDVAAGDYKDLGGVSVACFKGIGLPLKAVTGTDDIYVAVVNGTGTPTYTASGVKLRLGILQD